ncbi:Leu/Phe/Val dehydrogenase [Haloplasma contractile]|uniref:Leucine dehydrogenase protein n=1 Tax=Haloplasma contractile SSD-17B TaxID=1033810 RepID=U2FK28_9MOLU|nr:Glu/Leu/Phe/Val dehydrogenase [Haloplasma contractile]ERJ11584.1 Leucine dehydrogenase protein [Haloplasma contractile SSD-17B]
MNKFDYMSKYGYEQMVYFYDKETGLKGITCIHDTTLGPALGGTRLWNYATEEEAEVDVLRLARGMTYKAAAAGLNLGGGKTVLIGDADKVKSEAYWRAFGRYVQSLNGRYITAEDVNTSPDDMDYVAMETDYITGLAKTSGDPSPYTAYGVFVGIKATCKERLGVDTVEGIKVAVQGVGHVGYYLVKYLIEEGAVVTITDIKQDNIDRVTNDFDVTVVDPDAIYTVDCDVYAPCALGATVNDDTIDGFKCKVIAGAANNVLKDERHGKILEEHGILYAPDYVINAGGLINVYQEILGYDADEAKKKTERIYDRLLDIYRIAKENNMTTVEAANKMAEDRIQTMKNVRSNYIKR